MIENGHLSQHIVSAITSADLLLSLELFIKLLCYSYNHDSWIFTKFIDFHHYIDSKHVPLRNWPSKVFAIMMLKKNLVMPYVMMGGSKIVKSVNPFGTIKAGN